MELKNLKPNNLYIKFVGYSTKNGKKEKSRNIILNSLSLASRSLNAKAIQILKKTARYLGTVLELKNVYFRQNLITIPTAVPANRRNYLIVKKISKGVSEAKLHLSLEKKLIQEFVNTSKIKGSKSVLERELVMKDAVKHKANTHFRW
jgi:ribosomal protein S7